MFALGLPAFVLIKVFSPGFFAREDTRTPMWFAIVNAAVNIVLSVILFFRIGLVGIAIATSVAGWINTVLLFGQLWRLGHFKSDPRLAQRVPRIFLASLAMGAVLWLLSGALAGMLDGPFASRLSLLAVLVVAGVAAYALFVFAGGGARLSELKEQFRRKSA